MPYVGIKAIPEEDRARVQAARESAEDTRLRDLAILQEHDPMVKDLVYTPYVWNGCMGFYETVVLDKAKADEEKHLKESGLSSRFDSVTIETYTPKSTAQVALYTRLKKYVGLFKNGKMRRKDPNGIFLFGQVGTGKTYVFSALLKTLIGMGYSAIKTNPITLMREIRHGEWEEAPTNRALEKAKNIDFLFLDDLGKDKPTGYSAKTLFEIINYRLENRLPMLITSNYKVSELVKKLTPEGSDYTLGISVADRIYQGCAVIELAGMTLRAGRDAIL